MGTKDNRTKDHVMTRVGDSQATYKGQNIVFRQLNRYYLSLSPPVEVRDNDRAIITGRQEDVDLFVPITFSIIESAVPLFLFSQFGHVPYLDVQGRTQDDDEKKDAVRNMLDYDFQQSQIFLESIPFAKSVFKYGTGIGKVSYKYNARMVRKRFKRKIPTGFDFLKRLTSQWEHFQKKVPVVFYDGPTFQWVSIFNFGVDPLYWRPKEMRFKWERRWTDRDTLDWENAKHKELTGKPLYKNLEKIPKLAKGGIEGIYEMDAADDSSEVMGWSKYPGFRKQGYAQIKDAERDRDHAVEVLEYWEQFPEPRWVQIANGEAVIKDDGEDNFPNDDMEDPYVMTPCITLEGSPWGMGLIHPIKSPQEELNSYRNLNMRQARLNAMNLWAVDEAVDLPAQATEVEPGDVVQLPFFANGKPAMAPLMQGRPLPPESQIYEDRLLTDIQRAVAFSALRMGGAAERGINTATEAKMMGQAEQLRVQLYNMLGEHTFLQEVGRKFFSRRQQFFKEDQVFRILGADGYFYKQFTMQDIAGDYDFIPQGNPSQVGGEVLRQQLLQMLAVTGQNQAVAQYANVYEMWKEIWKRVEGIRFPEKFVIPPPERTWRPEQENYVLDQGEFVPVMPTDDHPHHEQVHMQGMHNVRDAKQLEAYQEHMKKHRIYTEPASAGGTAPQEQPGLKGYAGNVANPDNMGVESEGRIAARVGGMG
jgi:hypothetical protein